jgi:hypothetical protein
MKGTPRALRWTALARRWSLLLASLAALLLALERALAQEGGTTPEAFTKIDCAGANLQPPPGLKANCFQGPFAKVLGQYDCRLSDDTFGFLPDGTDPHFYVRVRYPKRAGKVCATIPFPDPTHAMQHVHKFVESEGTNWSGMQAIGNDINVMFFDAKDQKRDGKCFAFIKLGPMAGRAGEGHLFTMRGFFCKAPGQALDAATAAAMVNAVQLKM